MAEKTEADAPIVDYAMRCDHCGKLNSAGMFTRPWTLQCIRCRKLTVRE